MAGLWDQRYSAEEYVFGKEPNAFFKQVIDTLSPGKVFIPGAGEGRDAVYAAKARWDVYALDLSEKGREKALKLAAENGVNIHFEVGDIATYHCPANSFDAIALIYFHLPAPLRARVYPALVNCLKPGGTLILEAYNPRQINNHTGGPSDVTMMLTPEILADDFKQLKIIENAEYSLYMDEGPFHQGKSDIIRFVGVKQ